MILEARSLRAPPFLGPIDLALARGEILGIVGPNGAGKSTLLLALAALRPFDGELVFCGKPLGVGLSVDAYRRRISIAFQEPTLLDRTVLENVALPLVLQGLDRAQAGIWLSRFGLDALARRKARTLSGGEAQRVALARAFATGPELLLLDEPWSGLDAASRERLDADLAAALADRRASAIVVGHDRACLERLCDRLLVLDGGAVLQEGPPDELIRRPASCRVAGILGLSNLVSCTVLPGGSVDWDGVVLPLALPLPAGLRVELRIPEEAITPGEGLPAVALHRNAVRLANGRVLHTAFPLTRGENRGLSFDAARLVVLSPADQPSERAGKLPGRRIGP